MNLKIRQTNTQVAVVCHVWHMPEFIKILSQLEHIPGEYDLFISHSLSTSTFTLPKISPNPPQSVCVNRVENNGRDIFPFLEQVRLGKLFGYDFVLKLHTKRSPWLSETDLPVKAINGNEWFSNSLNSLCGSSEQIKVYFSEMRKSSNASLIISPYGSLLSQDQFIGSNERHISDILENNPSKLSELRSGNFPAGSMYWMNQTMIQKLSKLELDKIVLPTEPIPNDGSVLHALERIIGFLGLSNGGKLVEGNRHLKRI